MRTVYTANYLLDTYGACSIFHFFSLKSGAGVNAVVGFFLAKRKGVQRPAFPGASRI